VWVCVRFLCGTGWTNSGEQPLNKNLEHNFQANSAFYP